MTEQPMVPEPRTKQRAEEALVANLPGLIEQINDQHAKDVLTEQLVRIVFNDAWESQFDDDRRAFQRKVQELVSIEVEERFLES
jgi:hypothetical protein